MEDLSGAAQVRVPATGKGHPTNPARRTSSSDLFISDVFYPEGRYMRTAAIYQKPNNKKSRFYLLAGLLISGLTE
jgi:hypothetical protein